jgi:hypothetical protein
MEESFWVFQVIELSGEPLNPRTGRLPKPKVTLFRRKYKREVTSRRAPFGKKSVSLLSQANTETDTSTPRCSRGGFGEYCSSHLLLTQWANEISGFTFQYKAQEDDATSLCLSPSPVRSYAIPCEDYEMAVIRQHGLNTEFVLSEDRAILGLIFQSTLVTWEVESANQRSLARVPLDSYHYEEMKLVSLGHIYSIVGLEYNSSIIVLGTRSGQPLLKCADFATNHCRMVPPFIVFFSSVDNKWLSDITHLCNTRVLYWNKTNRSIEGVSLGERPSQMEASQPVDTRKRRRWQWQRS